MTALHAARTPFGLDLSATAARSTARSLSGRRLTVTDTDGVVAICSRVSDTLIC